ncbi:hypothetical protein BU23DRAFT_160508 [Bimuria novae-zelandiae CBS 107.79]|uniref:Uncharacterized protein n=1 Tax=Bimuria novae-zelandiae CBS 107.79 TaxID=1447943 RepID=A0A6A5V602_9PLEO|nr:hypothetical protein BU23DRAFT_160508 [Bimuria novae-zelandiae CBS 107.79]
MDKIMTSIDQHGAYAQPDEYQLHATPNIFPANTCPENGFLQTIMAPWMFPTLPLSQLNTSTFSPSTWLPPTPSTPLLSDLDLHRAYKTVGTRRQDTRCFNCLRETPHAHRTAWMQCTEACPACPAHAQHRGRLCPRLCTLRQKQAFWRERAGWEGPSEGVEGWRVVEGASAGQEEGDKKGLVEGAWGEREAQLLSQLEKAEIPCTPPLASASLVTSPASSDGCPKTPDWKEVIEMDGTKEMSSKMTLNGSLPRTPSSLPGGCQVRPVLTHRSSPSPNVARMPTTAGKIGASTRDEHARVYSPGGTTDRSKRDERTQVDSRLRTRSRSPYPERVGKRVCRSRDRSYPRSPPKPAIRLTDRPSYEALFSDTTFRCTVMKEAAAIAGAALSYDARYAPMDGVILPLLYAIKGAQQLSMKDWSYKPAGAMQEYLDYLCTHFPRLLSDKVHLVEKRRRHAEAGWDTYYGKAWFGQWWREEEADENAKLVELNRHLTERDDRSGTSYRPRYDGEREARAPERRDWHRRGVARRMAPASRGPNNNSMAPAPNFADDAPDVHSRLSYDDDPTNMPPSFPRGPRQHTGAPRDGLRQPTVQPQRQPPPPPSLLFTKAGSEDGEVVESNPEPVRDVLTSLETQLIGPTITEEEWEDLFKGDV